MNGDRVFDYVKLGPRMILDAGCGPSGSWWWPALQQESHVVAIDLYNRPACLPANAEFHQIDIMAAGDRREWQGQFDLIVADHLLEHLSDPEGAAHVLARVLAPEGWLHVGFPDAAMFTDRFYRLIHAEGGGHIAKLTRDGVMAMMDAAGLELVLVEPWEDSWTWLTDAFDFQARDIRLTSREDIAYIADVFRRELTPQRGYLYGWEMVFRKGAAGNQAGAVNPGGASRAQREGRWGRRWRRFVNEYVRGGPVRRARVVRDAKRLLRRRLGLGPGGSSADQ